MPLVQKRLGEFAATAMQQIQDPGGGRAEMTVVSVGRTIGRWLILYYLVRSGAPHPSVR